MKNQEIFLKTNKTYLEFKIVKISDLNSFCYYKREISRKYFFFGSDRVGRMDHMESLLTQQDPKSTRSA